MNKHVQRWKENHLKALESIGFIGSFRTLRTLENRANFKALQYNNGDISEDSYFGAIDKIKSSLVKLFKDSKLPDGFFFNGDSRGYALKIDDSIARNITDLYRDIGGYGLLAPNFYEMR